MTPNRSKSFAELVGFPGPFKIVGGAEGEAHGTTVLALRYKGGILSLGDRRATAANYIMYDRAEKVLALDDYTLIAISGSFARSIEVVRYLKHAFKYYARTQLQELSLEGKLQEVTRALASGMSLLSEGIGIFVPVVSAYDPVRDAFGIYFYDALGARFESGEFGAAGSGSERIRGIFDYISRKEGRFEDRPLASVLRDGLTMLDIASQLDSATGGFERIPPIAVLLEGDGIHKVSPQELNSAIADVSKRAKEKPETREARQGKSSGP